ncbi:MAG: DUF2075 domain-containing protein [Gammaproteobacteria bacterium]
MKRWFYRNSITDFLADGPNIIIGAMVSENPFPLTVTQRDAWLEQITILQQVLSDRNGWIYFEYSIPRMGKRVDAVLLLDSTIFVLEFKVGAETYHQADCDQVWHYALDLANFHETSHDRYIVPILIATEAPDDMLLRTVPSRKNDKTFDPVLANRTTLAQAIDKVLRITQGPPIDSTIWSSGRYCPTPTIVEAATALYNNHSVEDISRSDASATNLSVTSNTVNSIIKNAQQNKRKAICFVTGVPGAGKTLVGLNVATSHIKNDGELYSVFLSGNGPLVSVLREALVRDQVHRANSQGQRMTKREAASEVKMFIQNVHHFRDDCLIDVSRPPIEHVALFDEAQRAWDLEQTATFMRTKKKIPGFDQSEPEFLISCLDRHDDWAAIVCLVGGGQEINRGEAGIGEWVRALEKSFPDWDIWLSSRLTDDEYGAGAVLDQLRSRKNVQYTDELHLSVSLRSFRAENLSLFVKQLLDQDTAAAQYTLNKLRNYPVVMTRDLDAAKQWLRSNARGSERYGLLVSSQAERLKPYAIDIRPKIDPVHWFLNSKEDIRSSYYLEDVATEFHVQGLELDWSCVVWDADFRMDHADWDCRSFRGNRWTRIRQPVRKTYLKNAYRVLLTRARQGMAIVIPRGDRNDPTRLPEYYNPIYSYLKSIGIEEI